MEPSCGDDTITVKRTRRYRIGSYRKLARSDSDEFYNSYYLLVHADCTRGEDLFNCRQKKSVY
jgi:hypothetical protein